MVSYNISYESQFHGFPVQASRALGIGCHGEILQRLLDIFTHMTSKHCRTLFIRLDFRFPLEMVCPDSNYQFINVVAKIKLTLKRHGVYCCYCWVREDTALGRCHYHLALWLDGSRMLKATQCLLLAGRLWNMAIGLKKCLNNGLVEHRPAIMSNGTSKDGIMLVRGDHRFESMLTHGMYWSSYLAKTNTKEGTPARARCFGSSQLA